MTKESVGLHDVSSSRVTYVFD